MRPTSPRLDQPFRGIAGRADLILALAMAGGDVEKEARFAAMLGFVPILTSTEKEIVINTCPVKLDLNPVPAQIVHQTGPTLSFRPYQLVAIESIETDNRTDKQSVETTQIGLLTQEDLGPWSDDEKAYPRPHTLPIVPWTRLWPRLRQALARHFFTSLDTTALVQQFAKGLPVKRFPYLKRSSWPSTLSVVFDVSDRLTPYWNDWQWLQQHLLHRLNRRTNWYRLAGMPSNPLQPIAPNGVSIGEVKVWPELQRGDSLLIVSDLGWLEKDRPEPSRRWYGKLMDYRKRGINLFVVAPVAMRHIQAKFKNLAVILRLGPDSHLRPVEQWPALSSHRENTLRLSQSAETLLSMMSIATKVEPELLRALRSSLPENNRDVSLESEVWCYPEVDSAPNACALAPWAAQHWRERFSQLDVALQQRTLACLRQWHARLPQAIHHEEALLWRYLAKAGEGEQSQAERAQRFFVKLKNTFSRAIEAREEQLGSRALMVQYCDHHVHWVAPTLGKLEASYLTSLSSAIAQIESERIRAGLPEGIDPVDWLQSLAHQSVQRCHLIQQADRSLSLILVSHPLPSGSTRLATIDVDCETLLWSVAQSEAASIYYPWRWNRESTRNNPYPMLPVQLVSNTENFRSSAIPDFYLLNRQQRFCFRPVQLPPGASAWGQDGFGLFVDIQIESVIQRFRWIVPGTFLMGSPETELERNEDEIQHSVTLTQGFWLADSACTQALWQAVMMGENLARFQDSPDHPVDSVSWDDVQRFIQLLNTQQPNLQARLPTEAEWEYACRAGTTTPFSFGDTITSEQVNYNGDYPYAGAAKGLYRKKTVPVKSLPPNPWGLYEMHGNVLEWCADWFGDYPTAAVVDPSGPSTRRTRVLRGGSWNAYARWARSADRDRYVPGFRFYYIGFRLTLGPVKHRQPQSQAGESEPPEAAAED